MPKQPYIEELFDTMGQLRKLLAGRTHESNEDHTATAIQFSALMYLYHHENVPIGDLAGHLKLSKSSATQLIDRLAKAGFVGRATDPSDRRVVRLNLTPAGDTELANLKRKYLEKMSTLLSKVPEADLAELIRIQRNLIKTLQEEQE